VDIIIICSLDMVIKVQFQPIWTKYIVCLIIVQCPSKGNLCQQRIKHWDLRVYILLTM